MRDRVRAGLDALRSEALCDPKRMAAIGYCFGGTCVLELARSGADLAGVVSFHGGLATANRADARNIRGKVLVLHGGDDPHVPTKEVEAFEDEMRAGGRRLAGGRLRRGRACFHESRIRQRQVPRRGLQRRRR